MARKKSWTLTQEKIVIECVKEYPLNLSRAFRNASELIGRSYSAIVSKYYDEIRPNNLIFTVNSGRVQLTNVKNDAVYTKNKPKNQVDTGFKSRLETRHKLYYL